MSAVSDGAMSEHSVRSATRTLRHQGTGLQRWATTLNDLTWLTRAIVAGEALAVGVIVGGVGFDRAAFPGAATAALNCWLVGLALLVVVNLVSLAALTRSNNRQVAQTEAALGELLDVALPPGAPVPARVEYLRGGKISGGAIQPPPAGYDPETPGEVVAAVMTVLPDDQAPRRAMALLALPHDLVGELMPRGSVHVALLHPAHPETCVIDFDATETELAEAAGDPRWHSHELPTNSSLVGGFSRLVAVGAVAAACGAALSVLVALLS